MSISGRLTPSGSGKERTERSVLRRLKQDGGDLAGVVGPARRVEDEGGGGRPPAVGDRQLEEQGLQVELGVAQADVALAADGAAVADHAIDLQAGLDAAPADPAPQAHGQPVVGVRGRVQAIACRNTAA